MRALIVDDKEENIYYLQALLSGSGCLVETARHGAEALVKARSHPPELVVSDLLMPIMDGYTLLRHWKADARLKHIPFIVYTATYTEAEDEQLALNLGADAFILKPAEPEDFLRRVREVQANAAASNPVSPHGQVGDEKALLKVYSETLIRKLEEKSLQLEEANRSLQQDIANRKIAETSMRESEQRFRQLAENITEVFWITDPQKTQMLYISPAYEKIWGRSCESLYQNPSSWVEAIHAEDRDRILQAAMTQKDAVQYDEIYRILRPDGVVRWIHDRAFPVRNEEGEIYRVVGTAEDITERKRLEQQFLRAQRMESIGALAGGIAHDLNNVLAPILMAVPLLQQGEADEGRRNLLCAIESSAKRGAEMVQQVLSFARGGEGRQLLVQVGILVREIEKIANETFLKNIQVRCMVENNLKTVKGDPTQIHQVLLNLCVNARDAMPEGGTLTLSARNMFFDKHYVAMESEARPGPYVLLEIEDSGSGMPPEVMECIFDPFFTTKEPGKGTGLGLSTVSAIVKGHRGFLRVYSEVGRGTKFQVYLPADAGSFSETRESLEIEPPRGRGEMILVVDDEAAVREITKQTLETYGYRVILAADGAEAVAQYADKMDEIVLVFTDMMMPVMDGSALVKVVQRMSSRVKIVAASGLSANGLAAKATHVGVRRFITKPYTAETLLKTIREELDSV